MLLEKKTLQNIIFEADTPAGKGFDALLIVAILANSIVIMLESVAEIQGSYGALLSGLGWVFVGLFTVEYIIRIYVSERKWDYILSFYGMVDFLAIMPMYLGLMFPTLRFLVVIRFLRLLRLFGIFKMTRYVDESGHLIRALKASRAKITVFLFSILSIVVVVGAMMYIIEGPEHGFNSIPESMYWAIVTVSTVGYGDISPQTAVGKMLSSCLMIIAYGILAVPTGIITYELSQTEMGKSKKKKICTKCSVESISDDDKYCSKCGEML